MAVLRPLQLLVERCNGVVAALDVEQFLISSDYRETLPGGVDELPEQLFVRDEDGVADIGLYVSVEVLKQLEREDPCQRLHPGNLTSFLVALEGVSHFVFLVWRARRDLSVSALEMELQAEVDKFVIALLLLTKQGAGFESASASLIRLLFERSVLREEVPSDERERYVVASRVARKFCQTLSIRHRRAANLDGLKNDVRKYYRTGLADKLASCAENA